MPPEHLDRGFEQNDGRRAVDVVVAVEQDGLPVRDSGFHAFDRRSHAKHEQRVVKLGDFRIEEREGFCGGGDAARDEQFCQNQGNARCGGQSFGLVRVRC